MKKLLMLITIISNNLINATIDFGDNIYCQKKLEQELLTVILEITAPPVPYRSNGIVDVHIEVAGLRTAYSATYLTNIEAFHNRVGVHYPLSKYKDFSTWNDMPEDLDLYSMMSLGEELNLMLKGNLTGNQINPTVNFGNDDCFSPS